jgi:hypothetical protein
MSTRFKRHDDASGIRRGIEEGESILKKLRRELVAGIAPIT